ncbi:hypothetical protein [Actinomadura rugatobispora]|uniref:Uncharacterized protein n=1 Tax=Actinomadura rugatobispora TaxID=1994 RepID=A0ABW0ZRR1_9ACTN|nr:hypothetical protein GCM10010200_001820 [Actinomadura rugatobispora]
MAFLTSDRVAFITGCTVLIDEVLPTRVVSYADERGLMPSAGHKA